MDQKVSLSFIWRTERLYASRFLEEGWELRISRGSIKAIKLYWGNGFGDLCKKRILYGDMWLLRSVGYKEGAGVQRRFEGLMGHAFGRILRVGGGISPTLFPSRLGVDLVSVFGLMCGAEQPLSSLLSQNIIH
jgi:hypothetical protein